MSPAASDIITDLDALLAKKRVMLASDPSMVNRAPWQRDRRAQIALEASINERCRALVQTGEDVREVGEAVYRTWLTGRALTAAIYKRFGWGLAFTLLHNSMIPLARQIEIEAEGGR